MKTYRISCELTFGGDEKAILAFDVDAADIEEAFKNAKIAIEGVAGCSIYCVEIVAEEE